MPTNPVLGHTRGEVHHDAVPFSFDFQIPAQSLESKFFRSITYNTLNHVNSDNNLG